MTDNEQAPMQKMIGDGRTPRHQSAAATVEPTAHPTNERRSS
ncbi:hypothetical protein [Pseudarthrobacter sp. S9]